MFEFIADSGPFGILCTSLGAAAFALAAARVACLTRRDVRAAVFGLAAASLLIGLAGTGIGLRMAAMAISQSPVTPEEAASMWRAGVSIALTSTALGAAWSGATALVWGLGHLPGTRAA